jgi:hypothetical protein
VNPFLVAITLIENSDLQLKVNKWHGAQQCRQVARRSYSRKLLSGIRFESSSALGRAVRRSAPHSKEFRALSFYVRMFAVIPTPP